jgi:hypothetical protein
MLDNDAAHTRALQALDREWLMLPDTAWRAGDANPQGKLQTLQ